MTQLAGVAVAAVGDPYACDAYLYMLDTTSLCAAACTHCILIHMVCCPRQVCKHLQALGEVCRIRVVGIVGGLALVKQERLLGKRPAIVVATPGRLWALMRDGHAHLTDLSALSFLVLDEADRMVQQVRGERVWL